MKYPKRTIVGTNTCNANKSDIPSTFINIQMHTQIEAAIA